MLKAHVKSKQAQKPASKPVAMDSDDSDDDSELSEEDLQTLMKRAKHTNEKLSQPNKAQKTQES